MDAIHRNTVGDALRRAARVHRAAPALRYGDTSWSFTALDLGASRIARFFTDLGLRPGDRIAAYGRNSDAYFLAWLGCIRGGFVHVPVNYALTGEELAYIIRQSGARMVLAAASLEASLAGIAVERQVRLEDLVAVALDATIQPGPEPDIDQDTLAQIVYTSGTTAAPKGAMMTHGAMLAQYYSVIHHFEYRSTDRALAALPLYHTAQMHAFTMPQMLVGGADHADRGAGARPSPRAGRKRAHHLVLRAAHGVDQPAAPSGFRHARPGVAEERLLRRLDHAGASLAGAAAQAARRPALQRLWPDRDRALRRDPGAGGSRCPPGVLRAPGAERRNPRGRSGHERRARRHAWGDRAPLPAIADRILGQAGRNPRKPFPAGGFIPGMSGISTTPDICTSSTASAT